MPEEKLSSAAELLAARLDAMSTKILAHSQATKFSDSWGWQGLPLDKYDLAYLATDLAETIRSVDWTASPNAEELFGGLATKVDLATQNQVANLWANGQASDFLVAFLHTASAQVHSLASPDQIRGSLALPASLKKYVAAANRRLEDATKSIEGIEEKVASINAAHDAAERLPATQADLTAALSEVDKAAKVAERLNSKSSATAEMIEGLRTKLQSAEKEAQDTLEKVHQAYRAATSQGLAQAFSEKSVSLNQSMLLWVLVLLGALFVAGVLAQQRFPEILNAVTGKPEWGVVLLNLSLGALTFAPAIWVAWVSTKQIGQRFRLSEDYAYKAALATAYEGYRTEAAKLDPLFEAQLFATALGRLDELPLRLVERDVHGSPWHELVSSPEFTEAVEKFPELKQRIAAIFRRQKPAVTSPPSV